MSRAEKTKFQSSSFDLITIGQAVHWFDIPGFYKEATRVAKIGARLAIWGYGLLKINPAIDETIGDFYRNTIGPYWDPERKLIDQHHQTIPFPFEEILAPSFDFSFQWTIDELQSYITTW